MFGVINLIYEPEITRQKGMATWQRKTTLGLFTSIATAIQPPGVFLGAEARYLRKYDGLDLATLAGNALFVEPTMEPGSLDL